MASKVAQECADKPKLCILLGVLWCLICPGIPLYLILWASRNKCKWYPCSKRSFGPIKLKDCPPDPERECSKCPCPEAECGIWPRHKCKCKNPSPIPDWPFTNCAGLPTPIIYILATLCAGIGIFIFPIPQVWNKLRKNRGEPGADMVEAYGGARVGRAARRRK